MSSTVLRADLISLYTKFDSLTSDSNLNSKEYSPYLRFLVVRQKLLAPVAQWIEHRSSKPSVAGSSPARGAEEVLTSEYPFLLSPKRVIRFKILLIVCQGNPWKYFL